MDQQGRFSATAHPLENNEGGFFPELLKDAGSGLQRMIRAEVEQVKKEMAGIARRRAHVAVIISGRAVTLIAAGFVLLAAMFALELVLPNWLAALIVSVVAFIAGRLMVSAGRRQLRKSMQQASHDVPWLLE